MKKPKKTTVSMRLPGDVLTQIDRLADELAVDRTTIMRRMIVEGLEGLLDYERAGNQITWPRRGCLKLIVKPD